MNAGQFKTLDEVVNHYSRAPEAPASHSELKPLNLSDTEKTQLIAFLKTLSGPLATAPDWLKAPVPLPTNDPKQADNTWQVLSNWK